MLALRRRMTNVLGTTTGAHAMVRIDAVAKSIREFLVQNRTKPEITNSRHRLVHCQIVLPVKAGNSHAAGGSLRISSDACMLLRLTHPHDAAKQSLALGGVGAHRGSGPTRRRAEGGH